VPVYFGAEVISIAVKINKTIGDRINVLLSSSRNRAADG
jgi:aromatic ring-cleaving dioxygenase